MRIILLGAPGAGKGTQASILSERLNIPHISTGDIFRANIKEGTELGKIAEKYINEGKLVPDEVTVGIVTDRISKSDCKNGFLLDGFPRTIPQAECLDKALEEINISLDAAINIDVPDEVIVNRMSGRRVCPKCGSSYHLKNIPPKAEGICDRCGSEIIKRKDDDEDTVLKRLSTYHEQTEPLINYYSNKGLLKNVDGCVPLTQTTDEILELLGVE